MIKKSTCFVLGAGASHSYGFPLGKSLIKSIISETSVFSLDRHQQQTDFINSLLITLELLLKKSPNIITIAKFHEALRSSNVQSIDKFLQFRSANAEFEIIGKASIGYLLAPYELPEITRSYTTHGDRPKSEVNWNGGDDWLGHIWDAMISGPKTADEVLNSPISFVTFNYDRSLEFLLTDFAKGLFGWDDTEANRMLEAFPITHIYGDLGAFPRQCIGGSYLAYQGSPRGYAEAAASRIKTIHELVGAKDGGHITTLENAKSALRRAERIVFLGCAFHEENMQLLDINSWQSRKEIYFSHYGLTKIEVNRAQKFFSAASTTNDVFDPHNKSLSFLRSEVEL